MEYDDTSALPLVLSFTVMEKKPHGKDCVLGRATAVLPATLNRERLYEGWLRLDGTVQELALNADFRVTPRLPPGIPALRVSTAVFSPAMLARSHMEQMVQRLERHALDDQMSSAMFWRLRRPA